VFNRGLIATVALIACVLAGCGEAPPDKGVRGGRPDAGSAGADRAKIRRVIRRFNLASLAGDSGAMCALVDPAKLRYLELIGQPCEVSMSGRLTPDSERDVRTSKIISIEIAGDNAVAHTRGSSGKTDLRLRRTGGQWLIVGV
jgi:hypothetical protein